MKILQGLGANSGDAVADAQEVLVVFRQVPAAREAALERITEILTRAGTTLDTDATESVSVGSAGPVKDDSSHLSKRRRVDTSDGSLGIDSTESPLAAVSMVVHDALVEFVKLSSVPRHTEAVLRWGWGCYARMMNAGDVTEGPAHEALLGIVRAAVPSLCDADSAVGGDLCRDLVVAACDNQRIDNSANTSYQRVLCGLCSILPTVECMLVIHELTADHGQCSFVCSEFLTSLSLSHPVELAESFRRFCAEYLTELEGGSSDRCHYHLGYLLRVHETCPVTRALLVPVVFEVLLPRISDILDFESTSMHSVWADRTEDGLLGEPRALMAADVMALCSPDQLLQPGELAPLVLGTLGQLSGLPILAAYWPGAGSCHADALQSAVTDRAQKLLKDLVAYLCQELQRDGAFHLNDAVAFIRSLRPHTLRLVKSGALTSTAAKSGGTTDTLVLAIVALVCVEGGAVVAAEVLHAILRQAPTYAAAATMTVQALLLAFHEMEVSDDSLQISVDAVMKCARMLRGEIGREKAERAAVTIQALVNVCNLDECPSSLRKTVTKGLALIVNDVAALLPHSCVSVRSAALSAVTAVVKEDATVSSLLSSTTRTLCHELVSCFFSVLELIPLADSESSKVGLHEAITCVVEASRLLSRRRDASAALSGLLVKGLLEMSKRQRDRLPGSALAQSVPSPRLHGSNVRPAAANRSQFYSGRIGSGIRPKLPGGAVTVMSNEWLWGPGSPVLEFADVVLISEESQTTFCEALSGALTAGTMMPTAEEYLEHHFKVPTTPRDLALANSFSQCPPLWDLLALGARFPTSFFPCADVVASLLAILAGKWCSFANASEDKPLFAKQPFTLRSVRKVGLDAAMVTQEPKLQRNTNILLQIVADAKLTPVEGIRILEIAHLLSAREIAKVLLHFHKIVLAAPPKLSQYSQTADGNWTRQFPDPAIAADLKSVVRSACHSRMDFAAGVVYRTLVKNA
eukprot:m.49129 g.49129  ORF g.49129 m.49129 type:complete len:976 (-) comp8942_c0_seq1:2563-5490(-)